MGNGKYQPILKASYSSGGVLQNIIIPRHIDRLMVYMAGMATKDKQCLEYVFSSLYTLIPPFRKLFRNYDDLILKVKECRKQLTEWRNKGMADWPVHLEMKLLDLYADWWQAFLESGLGIHYEQYIDRDTRIKNALRNL